MNGDPIQHLFAPMHGASTWQRVLLIALVTVTSHLLVVVCRRLGQRMVSTPAHPERRKLHSVVSLLTSGAVFTLYFVAAGFVLGALGISITAYFASATIIGLAVGFGSQGLVQDVVSGLTTIFSDLFDVGDMVEIGGQAGIVRAMGLRFVDLENSMGATVHLPNRFITNVTHYPRGYVRCIADVTISADATQRAAMVESVEGLARGVHEQFPAILLTPPAIEGEAVTSSGKHYLRIKFRIWPGRGQPIEETFRQEVVQSLKRIDPDYDSWMVTVYYEVEQKSVRSKRP